ncbi:hypothetical protein CDAR_283251 [Caerostris darwini]|uniref:Uncharacterized protein n=1 Tax=Caerostris darwini TaxID=1538125 RepID=A0AAV4TAU3_9ARAC|nr:hypothetical protein CDAR_283241 [Caerostris darwini]GIY43410.1 hypothetical protein CDAR_283251 [Caerostris darwini]
MVRWSSHSKPKGAPMEKPVSHRQPREVHSGLVSLGGGSERQTAGARLVTRGSGSTPAQSSLSSLGTFKKFLFSKQFPMTQNPLKVDWSTNTGARFIISLD